MKEESEKPERHLQRTEACQTWNPGHYVFLHYEFEQVDDSLPEAACQEFNGNHTLPEAGKMGL